MSYYAEKLAEGKKYEEFLSPYLSKHFGVEVKCYQTKKEQLTGENDAGIEIKFDGRMSETGNIYLELLEKTNEKFRWTMSGIFRSDNSTRYAIGNYNLCWVFDKRKLQTLFLNGDLGYDVISIGEKTSRGILVGIWNAAKHCDVCIVTNGNIPNYVNSDNDKIVDMRNKNNI